MLVSDLDGALDDGQIRLHRAVRAGLVVLLVLAPRGRAELLRPARQVSAAQRGPGDQTDAGVVAEAVHLALLLAVQEIVLVLHADELGPAVLLGDELEPGELGRPHAAGADVADLAGLDKVVQGLHGLLQRHVGVEAVDLQQVDVRSIQTLQRCLDLVEDGGAGETAEVLVVLGPVDLVTVELARASALLYTLLLDS